MATYYGGLAWEMPWTEEPGGYSPRGLENWTRLGDKHIIIMDSAG